MDYIGIDLHKNSSQVCILTEDGELVERRIKTDRESFDKLLGERPPARILVEASLVDLMRRSINSPSSVMTQI